MASCITSSHPFPDVLRQEYQDPRGLSFVSSPSLPVKSSLRDTVKKQRRLTPMVPMIQLFQPINSIAENERTIQDIRNLRQDIRPLREKVLSALGEVRFLAERLAESERRAKAYEQECVQARDQLGIFVIENETLRRDLERVKLALHESENMRHQSRGRFTFPFSSFSGDTDTCNPANTDSRSSTPESRAHAISIKRFFKMSWSRL